MHGTADPYISYYTPYGNLWPIEETLNFWIENNGCSLLADTISLPDIDPNDGCTVDKITYKNCSEDSIVVHYQIINGGHPWPGTDLDFTAGGNINQDIHASVEILNFFQNYENPLSNIAFAKSIEIAPKYCNPQGDSLHIIARLSNPEGNSVEVYALIQGEQDTYQDSIQLFDDGLHGDGDASDNIWGETKFLSSLEEEIFLLELSTNDLTAGLVPNSPFRAYFSSIGPLIVDDYEIPQQLGSIFRLNLSLKNNGSISPAIDVKAKLFTNDTNVTDISNNNLNYFNIEPGQSKFNSSSGFIVYTQNNPESVKFNVHIFSSYNLLWSDTITVNIPPPVGVEDIISSIPTEFGLYQSYPNPFNPTTTIGYSIPELSFVTLRLFDVLGNEITILVNEEKPVGNYEVEFEASNLSSGIYFYRLQAGDFVDTKKMVLLK
jgi:hypothetical protein